MPSPAVIGVAGGSGSGKTTVVTQVIERLGDARVTRIQHDWYYVDRGELSPAERAQVNYDHPDALETALLVEHLAALKAGRPIDAPVYDFARHRRTGDTRRIEPRRVVIVEGILILAEPALRALMDVRVFVDTDPDIRFIRRFTRDVRERDRRPESVIDQYLATVRPMHIEFVEPSRRHAHIIIPEGGRNQVAVDMLIAKIATMAIDPVAAGR